MSQPAEEILGLGPQADQEQIRSRYLELVRRYPPDREPEQFQRVREAYEQLRDPRRRALQRHLVDPNEPLVGLLNGLERRPVGPGPWLDVLRGGRP